MRDYLVLYNLGGRDSPVKEWPCLASKPVSICSSQGVSHVKLLLLVPPE